MSNEIMGMLGYFWFLSFLSGIFTVTSYQRVRELLQSRRRKKQYPYLESAHENLLCKGPHSWDRMKLAMPPLPIGMYTICKDCGLISTDDHNFKLNKPAMEVFKNNIKIRDEALALSARINKKKDDLIEELRLKMLKDFSPSGIIEPVLDKFFNKTVSNLDGLYEKLNKELDSEKNRG